MHIYHYASYEKTHLLSLAARHGIGEDEVDDLLRDHVLVDLYPIVRQALRVGSDSYSIKRLEPLYMGDDLRTADVSDGAASITAYSEARRLARSGHLVEGQEMLDEIADYNAYDCRSTLRLRDWLLGHARAAGIDPATPEAVDATADDTAEPSPVRDALVAHAGDPLDPDRDADATAAALAAAALDYHRRERKSFWWAHFARLVDPIDEWADTKDVFVVEDAEVVRDWYREGRQQTDRRELVLRGTLAPGSSLAAGATPFALYGPDGPALDENAAPGARQCSRSLTVKDVLDDGSVLVEERQPKNGPGAWSTRPLALVPGQPISTKALETAIGAWTAGLAETLPAWPADAVSDVLRRRAPRTRSGRGLEVSGPEAAPTGDALRTAVVASLRDLDDSFLAVQGPPGTGKTYLGSRVIAELVRDHGWKVGVVAQSHAVVENFLAAVVEAGLDPSLLGKSPGGSGTSGDEPYTVLPKQGPQPFIDDHAATGFVLGGTAWTFSNAHRVAPGSLDLLVIDEAGQFSLAATIASGVAARNLLLLGDPQQLPQVSQGSHPEPVDESALGWISDGHDVLPRELGFFLAESYRMHPAVTAPVSRLAYAGELRSHSSAAERRLDGIEPGLHVVPIRHAGNANASPEEAAEVVRLVQDALGRTWDDGRSAARPIQACDVIVVTPYNAQRQLVHDELDAVGLGAVRVGTVDKFQGQEAAVAIVTLAASSAEEVPRGLSFLIMKNRLNVAISRAQWAAWLVCSPGLAEHLPPTPAGVAELSGFLRLLEGAADGAAPATLRT